MNGNCKPKSFFIALFYKPFFTVDTFDIASAIRTKFEQFKQTPDFIKLPQDAPHDIPIMIINDNAGSYVQFSRIKMDFNFMFNDKTKTYLEEVREKAKAISDIAEKLGINCYRVGLIINYSIGSHKSYDVIVNHFSRINDLISDEFVFGWHKIYNSTSFQLNRWMKVELNRNLAQNWNFMIDTNHLIHEGRLQNVNILQSINEFIETIPTEVDNATKWE